MSKEHYLVLMHPTLLQYISASIELIYSTRQQDVESSLFGERQLPLYKTLNPLLSKVKLTNFLFVKKKHLQYARSRSILLRAFRRAIGRS